MEWKRRNSQDDLLEVDSENGCLTFLTCISNRRPPIHVLAMRERDRQILNLSNAKEVCLSLDLPRGHLAYQLSREDDR